MDDNERTIRLDEYKKLKEQLLHEMEFNNQNNDNQNNIIDFNGGQSSSKVKSFNNGHYKEGNPNNLDYYSDRKAGMVNVLMLSIMTFVFECLFLFLSFMIYN